MVNPVPGPGDDYPEEVKVDNNNEIFLMGSTLSEEFATDIQETVVNTHSGCSDLFLAKFSSQGVLQKTRFLGGENDEGYNTFCVQGPFAGTETITGGLSFDINDNVFVATYTNSEEFPVESFPSFYNQSELGNDAMDTDNGDAAVIALNNDLEDLWITYLGGQSGDPASGEQMWESGGGAEVVFDRLFVTGSTTSACDIRIPLKDVGSASNPAIHYAAHLNLAATPVNQKDY